jgi:hypothetical protein
VSLRPLAIALVVLAACGRIGFDARDDATSDDSDTPLVGNRAFVTSTVQTAATFGGLPGADAVCTDRAREAGLPGNFVAYLSTSTVNAKDRLAGARGWYRVDGTPLFDTVEDLLAKEMILPPRLDEYGTDLVAAIEYVTTGTYEGTVNTTCGDYTDPAGFANGGIAAFTAGSFSNQKPIACNELTRLYCFQTDHAVPLAFTPAVGRGAFLSTASFTPSSGIAAADAICAGEAQAASLRGTFLAVLPTTLPAAQRFNAAGAPWVRTDGILLARTAADFFAGVQLAPLNVTAAGAYDDTYVVTGGYLPAQSADPSRNCDVWTNAAGGNALGYSPASNDDAFTQTTADCVNPHRVYCLEN